MDYNSLKTSVSAYMRRGAALDAMLDTFIGMFEARASRILRSVEMETTAVVVPVSDSIAIPTNFQAFRSVVLKRTPNVLLEYASPTKMEAVGAVSGFARYYTLAGNLVKFAPSAANANIEWTYYASIPGLTASNLTNWLINKYPDYYLFGCIYQAMEYTRGPEAEMLAQKLAMLENEINHAARSMNSGPMVVVSA